MIAELAPKITRPVITPGRAMITAEQTYADAEKRFGSNAQTVLEMLQPGQDPRRFLDGFQNAYILGKQGNHAALNRSSAAAYLTEAQKETAFGSGMRVRANGLGVSQQTQRMLGASGNTGEKAKPYSQRGIQIEQRLQGYLRKLGKNGDYISVPSGEIRSSDLAVLTTETGVEFTIVKAAGKTFLIRGDEKYTTIPQELFELILDSRGSIDCHSHPYIGDLIPSEADMQMMELLTWLDESTIIDPTEKTARFNSFGLVDMGMETNKRDASYYENMDWGGD